MPEKLYLQRAELSGFRTIKDVSVDFKDGLNIIIGKNAAGKTNFLNFLYKSITFSYKDLYNFNANLHFRNGNDLKLTAKSRLTFKLGLLDTPSINTDAELKMFKNGKEVLSEKSFDKSVVSKLRDKSIDYSCNLICHGLPKIYPIVETPRNVLISRDGVSEDVFDLAINSNYSYFINSIGIKLLTFLSVNRAILNEEIFHSIFRNYFNDLNKVLIKFSPIKGVKFSDNLRLQLEEKSDNIIVSNIYLEFKIGNIWLPFSSLSDGTKRLFYILAEVSDLYDLEIGNLKFVETIKKYRPPRIVLLEEPELGIHPHQFQKLMEFLKIESEKKQIMISTHSPQALDVLNENELDRIIIAYNEEGDSTKLRHLTKAEMSKAKQYIKEDFLSDYWLYSDLES